MKELYQFICDFWQFIKDTYEVQQKDEEYFQRVVDRANEISYKYKASKYGNLVRNLLVTYLEELEDLDGIS